MKELALSLAVRLVTAGPLGRLTLALMEAALKKYGTLLPREALGGLDSLFYREATRNVDLDGDGVDDSFRLVISNAWFNQRITGIRLAVDGRDVPPGDILVRTGSGEIAASDITVLDFPPGKPTELISRGWKLEDGFHILSMELGMELVPQSIPFLPLLMEGGRGDFPFLADSFHPLPTWPPEGPTEGRAHMVQHIHYDVEWLKTREVFEEVGARNLLEVIRLMEEDPGMTFVVDQVPQLEPFREKHPASFERLVELIRQGRIEPVNGMYSEPDVNIPSGESLVRQTVAWQKYCVERFGRASSCGWLIDSFGQSAQLPQIFKLSGVEYFVFSRAAPPEWVPSEFLWEGLDGTRIITHNMPYMYNVGYPTPADMERALARMLRDYLRLRERSAGDQVLYPSGVDHGQPQGEFARAGRAWNREVPEVEFVQSLPSRFFRSLDTETLPVVKGEFQRELWGTYSARSDHKRLNRECEFALTDAGKIHSVASLLGGEIPEDLGDCWRTLMDNQFHDQICGCCTDEVAHGMTRRFEEVLRRSGELIQASAGYIAAADGTEDEYTVLVFNPLSVPVASWVEFEFAPPPGWRGFAVEHRGVREPVQVLDRLRHGDGTISRIRAGLVPELPPLGYRVFRVLKEDDLPEEHSEPGAGARGMRLFNELLELEVDPDSGLIGGLRVRGGPEFDLRGANRLTLERDFGNQYQAIALGTTFLRRRKVESVRVVEPGPLRCTAEIRGRLGRSGFVQRVSLVAGSPRVDLSTEVDFRDKGCRLRCVFPTGLGGGRWIHEVPYGWMERPGHELPAQNFADLSTADRGITLINMGVPGNKHDSGEIITTLLRSTDKIFFWDSGPGALQLGNQRFSLSLYPHRGGFDGVESSIQAYLHNDPPLVTVFPGRPSGEAPPSLGAVETEPGKAMVSVMEMEPRGLVLRLWDTSGEGHRERITTAWTYDRAYKADLSGKAMAELEPRANEVEFEISAFEIATLVFTGVRGPR